MDPEIASYKQSIVNVLCRDSVGNRFVIEMQLTRDKGFEKRAQLHAAKAYSRQLDKSGKYIDLKKVFFIAISNCNLFPNEVDYISTHTVRDIKTNGHYLKGFQSIFIELPKFSKSRADELKDVVERWCFFFKYADETTDEDLKEITKESEAIKLAYDELNTDRWNMKDLVAYEERIMDLRKEEAILEYKLDNATKKGIKFGKEKGRAEGILEGRKLEKIEVVKNLLKEKVLIEIIVQSTGLTIEEIENLK